MEIKELALFNFFELASKFFSRNENKYNKDSNYFTEFFTQKDRKIFRICIAGRLFGLNTVTEGLKELEILILKEKELRDIAEAEVALSNINKIKDLEKLL